MFRIPIIAVLICSVLSAANAQDSAKKAKPLKVGTKFTNHTYPHQYLHSYLDSAAAKAKHDSAATMPAIDKSLNSQYQYLLTKVYHYQAPLVTALWKNASDTLNINRAKLKQANARLSVQAKTLDSLSHGITAKEQTLNENIARTNQISILGFYVSKTIYNIIVWGLILVFGATAFIVISRSGSLSREAKYRTQLYTELEDEFKAYKAKANEKEKKLARELQTERNKLDDLLGK